MAKSKSISEADSIASAKRTIETETSGLKALAAAMDGKLSAPFTRAVETIREITGRVIVTGVGKSGHVGSKLAATLASTGTPAFFVHAAEANHGDLGMIARDDVIIALSWSGGTTELKGVLAYATRFQIPLIAITRDAKSDLGREATICLELPQEKEACPHNLAPTTSTLMQMAIGDALAIALLESHGFTADDFGLYHPGGSLGASLTRVSQIMHPLQELPMVDPGVSVFEAASKIPKNKFGCVGVVTQEGRLAGIITDGDLRRNIERDIRSLSAGDIMSANPKTVSPDTLATSAMAILNEKSITALFVVEDEKPVGLVHIHDLLRIGAA